MFVAPVSCQSNSFFPWAAVCSMLLAMMVNLKHLYISPGHNYYGRHGKGAMNYPIEEVDSINCVAGRGIEGDRFFDYKPDYKGQITLFDWAVYQRVRDEIVKGPLDPKAFRRNVVLQGLDLNELIDKRWPSRVLSDTDGGLQSRASSQTGQSVFQTRFQLRFRSLQENWKLKTVARTTIRRL